MRRLSCWHARVEEKALQVLRDCFRVAVRGVAAVTGEFRRRDRDAGAIDLAAAGEGVAEWNVQNASPPLMQFRTSL